MTFLDALLSRRASTPTEGKYRWYAPDLLLLPDYALALMLKDLPPGAPFPHARRCLVTADHFAPPSSTERAEILRRVLDRAREGGCPARIFEGICHQLLVEDGRCRPFRLVIGSDSHSGMAGGLGALAFGFGSTDVWGALVHGAIALPPLRPLNLRLRGRLPGDVSGGDLARELFRRLGPRRLADRWVAIEDLEAGLPMADRFALCNLLTEAGVACAVVRPDECTRRWLQERDGEDFVDFDPVEDERPRSSIDGTMAGDELAAGRSPDELAALEIDLGTLEPLVSLPSNPFDVSPLDAVAGLELHQVFLGSCASGRLEDLRRGARTFGGGPVAPGLKALLTPASRRVWLAASAEGLLDRFVAGGVTVLNPSCGPCGAVDKGLLAGGERCACTLNRNYRGRMGSPDAEIYLVGPSVVGAAMRLGRLPERKELVAP